MLEQLMDTTLDQFLKFQLSPGRNVELAISHNPLNNEVRLEKKRQQ
jgi:hypothetical protein